MRKLLALKLFAFVAIGLAAVLAADLGQAIAESFLVPQENAMHAAVNDARASKGLKALKNDTGLRWLSRRQSQAMASAGYIYHNTDLPADADAADVAWVSLGENVGRGPEWGLIQRAFEGSPPHYKNIVNGKFNALGVGGLADPGETLYFTQTYATLEAAAPPPPPPTAPPAPSAPPAPPVPTAPPAASAAPPPAPSAPPVPDPTPVPEAPSPDPEPEPEPDPVEVQGDSVGTEDAEPPAPPERPSLISVLVAMAGTLLDKLTFWN